jgi:hypothetical protein
LNPREVLIVGPPRSGTTLAARLLGGRPQTLCLSEPHLCWAIMAPWQLNRFFHNFQKSAGLRRRHPAVSADAERFARFLRQMARENAFDCLIIKETYRRHGLTPAWHNEPLLERLIARRVPIIALLRHPHDVVASTIKLCRWATGWRGRLLRLRHPAFCTFPDTTAVVRWAADNWTCYVAWARRHGLTITRYEDIVADPHRCMQTICNACHLEFSESMLDTHRPRAALGGIGDMPTLLKPRPVDQACVGRGHQMSPEHRQMVCDTCAAIARDFDYAC